MDRLTLFGQHNSNYFNNVLKWTKVLLKRLCSFYDSSVFWCINEGQCLFNIGLFTKQFQLNAMVVVVMVAA